MNYKTAVNYLIGDRELPLEGNKDLDIDYTHKLVGDIVETSPACNGSFEPGVKGTVTGVYTRYGQVIGLQVIIDGVQHTGSIKDFYIHKCILEDVQVLTAKTLQIKECMAHWTQSHTYWLPYIDGVEAFCFELASVVRDCKIDTHPDGFNVTIPDTHPQDTVEIKAGIYTHNNFYSLNTMIVPKRSNKTFKTNVQAVSDHWMRTYMFEYSIVTGMIANGLTAWTAALEDLVQRVTYTTKYLQPLLELEMRKVLKAYKQITGVSKPNIYLQALSIGCSRVRLKAGTIGLTEPPTDRRPYTVITIGPDAILQGIEYVQQVVLHECIHVCVANVYNKEPHTDLFHELAEMCGLEPEHRD